MQITAIEPFLDYFEGFRKRTLRVADRIPPDRIEWSYRAGKFSCGDILRHLGAIERYMFVENACGRPSRYPGHSPELAAGYLAVRAFLDRMHAESVELLSGLGPEDLTKKCVTPAGTPITVWKWLRAMVEHEAHHRGQIYLYLALLGIEGPPLYGLTEEEVAARSLPRGEGVGPGSSR
ncbi:MAG: DinB family protein [Acidobacteriota bacterium]|nr:DinB family protein [Acidobacteriota bacterium]MDH3525122.1 DinB family protein [Acidobacteriota bacterium]